MKRESRINVIREKPTKLPPIQELEGDKPIEEIWEEITAMLPRWCATCGGRRVSHQGDFHLDGEPRFDPCPDCTDDEK